MFKELAEQMQDLGINYIILKMDFENPHPEEDRDRIPTGIVNVRCDMGRGKGFSFPMRLEVENFDDVLVSFVTTGAHSVNAGYQMSQQPGQRY